MQPYYIQRFTSYYRYRKELLVYKSAFKHKADLISARNQTLTLSHIDGIPYLDVNSLTEEIIKALAEAISAFHDLFAEKGKVWCHWDNQPRNILWSEKQHKIYLLDFEGCRIAPPEADIAHLMLFWAATMPQRQFLTNIELFLSVYESLVTSASGIWEKAVSNSIIRFDQRRKKYNKCEPLVSQDMYANRRLLKQINR